MRRRVELQRHVAIALVAREEWLVEYLNGMNEKEVSRRMDYDITYYYRNYDTYLNPLGIRITRLFRRIGWF